MLPSTFHLEFITPLFSKGMYDDIPEVRAPSIRGQLHLWFRALGHRYADEQAIFGTVSGEAAASRVVVRVADLKGTKKESATLPHDPSKLSPKMSLLPGASFTLHLLPRLGGLDSRLQALFDLTLEAWLLMGSLGLRSTRGAGSFCWQNTTSIGLQPPQTFDEYETRCRTLLAKARTRFALLHQTYTSAEAAHRDCSDTIGGDSRPADWFPLSDIRWPLGNVRTGKQKAQVPDAPSGKPPPCASALSAWRVAIASPPSGMPAPKSPTTPPANSTAPSGSCKTKTNPSATSLPPLH